MLRPLSLMVLLLFAGFAEADDFFNSMEDDLENLTREEPLSVLGVGALASAGAWMYEAPAGYSGFMGEGFLHTASIACDYAFGPQLLAAAAGIWAGGSLSGSPDTEETGQMLTEGLLLSYGITGSLKLLTHRERPDGSSFMSFPSGHSSGTASCAVILWDRYGPKAGIPAAALAVFSALSRVQLGRHYPSDVLAGSAIGLASGLAVVETRRDREEAQANEMSLGISWSSRSGFGVYF